MRTLLSALPGLACAGSMALLMWMMSRRGGVAAPDNATRAGSQESQLSDLEDEVKRLRAEVQTPAGPRPA